VGYRTPLFGDGEEKMIGMRSRLFDPANPELGVKMSIRGYDPLNLGTVEFNGRSVDNVLLTKHTSYFTEPQLSTLPANVGNGSLEVVWKPEGSSVPWIREHL
jgi:hypothetical protein